MNQNINRFSDAVSTSLERLFKAGGLSLVFIFVGFATMIIGHFYISPLSVYIFGVGAFLSLSILTLFLYTQVRGATEARRIVKENKELLDSAQDIAIGLTNTISETQSLLFKHAEDIGRLLEIATPFLSQLPFLNNVNLAETLNVNNVIVNVSGKSKDIVDDIHKALVNGDINGLKKYSDDLKKSANELRKSLGKETNISQHIPDMKVIQDNFVQLTNSFLSLHSITSYYVEQVDLILEIVVPFLSTLKLSGIGKKINELGIAKLQELSSLVNQQLKKSKSILEELHRALTVGNMETITNSLKELQEIEKSINSTLRNNTKK